MGIKIPTPQTRTLNVIEHGMFKYKYLYFLFILVAVGLLTYVVNMYYDLELSIMVGSGSFLIFCLLIALPLYGAFNNKSYSPIDYTSLLQNLCDSYDHCMIVTNLQGHRLFSNESFDLLSEGVGSLSHFLEQKLNVSDLSAFMHRVQLSNSESLLMRDSTGVDIIIKIQLDKVDGYFVWKFIPRNHRSALSSFRDKMGADIQDVFEMFDIGFAVENNDGHCVSLNSTLQAWLDIDDCDSLPSKLIFREHESQLLTSNNNRIDVQVHTVPIFEAGSSGTQIGVCRYIYNQNSLRHSPVLNTVFKDGEGFGLNTLFDGAPLAMAIINSHFEILEHNKPLLPLLGGDKPSSILDLVKADYRDGFEKAITAALSGTPPVDPLDVEYSSKKERNGQAYFSTINKDGEGLALLYCTDNTQEKSLEAQFVQAQKMQAVGQLAGGVAHDFNNLLTAIIGFCDLLLLRHTPGDESFPDINQVKQNANRAANLVRQLLAFSRQQTMRPTVLSVTDVISELSNLLRRLIGEKIIFSMNLTRDLPNVKVDQGQLEQVIINLAVNARDAMPAGGELEINTRLVPDGDPLLFKYPVVETGDYVVIEVVDNGEGISEDIRQKIFEPFFTTKPVGEGTGLGLATVYGIVKQTGGYVFVDSTVGEGTSFFVLLKQHIASAEDEVIEVVVEEKGDSDLTGKEIILLVEDEGPVRMFASRALENKGYTVLQAQSGEEGLASFVENKDIIDLIITDVIMPTMDGPTLVKEIKKTHPDLPVIFVSGYAEDILRNDLEADEFHFLSKPFSLKDLAEKVKLILS